MIIRPVTQTVDSTLLSKVKKNVEPLAFDFVDEFPYLVFNYVAFHVPNLKLSIPSKML